jgi:4-carboxymuconolactone decarboxylase
MGTDRVATPEDRLRALASGEVPVLEALARMQVGAAERSNLDEETYVLVRLAALVATDAAPVSYLGHLAGDAAEVGVSMDEILRTFVAIAPIVGSSRVLSAASRMAAVGLIATEVDEPLTETV